MCLPNAMCLSGGIALNGDCVKVVGVVVSYKFAFRATSSLTFPPALYLFRFLLNLTQEVARQKHPDAQIPTLGFVALGPRSCCSKPKWWCFQSCLLVADLPHGAISREAFRPLIASRRGLAWGTTWVRIVCCS